MQASAQRAAACDAATALQRLNGLASSSKQAACGGGAAALAAVEQAQELAWLLCDMLGTAQALMARRARFVQVHCTPGATAGPALVRQGGAYVTPSLHAPSATPCRPAWLCCAPSWSAWSS